MIAVFNVFSNRVHLLAFTPANYQLCLGHVQEYGEKAKESPSTDALSALLTETGGVSEWLAPCNCMFVFRPEW